MNAPVQPIAAPAAPRPPSADEMRMRLENARALAEQVQYQSLTGSTS